MKRAAFTLVELLVVISIIGILSTVAVVATDSARRQALDARRKADLVQLAKAIEMYNYDNGDLPMNTVGFCFAISNPNGWGDTFKAQLAPYMANIPKDPAPINMAKAYDYIFYSIDNKTKYSLCTNLGDGSGGFSMCSGHVEANYCYSPNGT